VVVDDALLILFSQDGLQELLVGLAEEDSRALLHLFLLLARLLALLLTLRLPLRDVLGLEMF
jgi:hypothetical protein